MTETITITREIAQKVRDTVDRGLSAGLGANVPGQMCVEAAVCYALGLPHGDDPGCVATSLRELKIRLNDAQWSSNHARAKGLRRLAVAQLGSAGVLDDADFAQRVMDMTIRRAVPHALRSAASVNPEHSAALEAAAIRCEHEGTGAAAAAFAAGLYSAAAAATAYNATGTWFADAATYAADAAAFAAAAATYADDAADSFLTRYAELVVEILIDMKAPGCQWLDLVPKDEA